MPYTTVAHINSLKGEVDEITVLEQVGDNDYIVDYKGVKCHAIFQLVCLHVLRRRPIQES